ncbi:MAG: hypothetical protein V5A46_05980 [Haloferacaceae archaeon]
MRPSPPALHAGVVLVVAILAVWAIAAAGGGVAAAGAAVAADDPTALDRGGSGAGGFDAVVETAPADGTAALPGDDRAVDDPAVDGSASTTDALVVRTELRRAEPTGEYGATTRVTIPDRVSRVNVTLPAEAGSVRATGFDRAGPRTYAWDGETAEPRLRYRMEANRTGDRGPLAGDGEYLFVDTEEWSLVRMPNLRVGWAGYGSDVRLRREHAVEGEGAAGDVIAYLGPAEEHVREAHGQRFRLVVPAAADLDEPPEAILTALADSSDALRVGDRDPSVFVVAAPTGDVSWAVRGLQTGPADVWVRDLERLDDPENVWVHEYVHTRQGYVRRGGGSDGVRWFTEGSATYYAALLTLERGDVGFEEFRRVLARGERSPGAESVLSEPASWRNAADYTKGALVAGEIDRRIRLATDGEATLATVFRELNAEDDPTDSTAFVALVDDAGGEDPAGAAERFTTTREVPPVWDREAHDEAFGRLPARIGYSIAGEDAVRATGPYRDRPVARDPVALAAGETLEVAVEIENAGGTAGEYDLTLAVDGRVEGSRDGRVAANGTTVERFERTFENPGEYGIVVGGERLRVLVREPATPTVVDLAVTPSELSRGGSATVAATVRNDGTYPARGTFPVVVDGEPRDSREVFLDASEETRIEWTVRLDRRGDIDVAVGDRSRTVTVAPGGTPSPEPPAAASPTGSDPGDGTAGATPGFGPTAALVAIVATLLAIGARRDG